MAGLPNLFRTEPERSQWYYERFLSRLLAAGRSERVIEACRQIRRFAAKCNLKSAGAFTYHWELDALGDLRDFDSMWRVLRAREEAVDGGKRKLSQHKWKPGDVHQLIFFYAPVLYLRGRYQLGCKLMEIGLSMAARRKGWSFEMPWHVYKPETCPMRTYDVTLAHFYSALDRPLQDWPLWEQFVGDFDASVLRRSKVSRTALNADPTLIKPVFEWISAERKRRLFSGSTDGLRDLTDPATIVRKRQAAIKKKMLQLEEDPKREKSERELDSIFPELKELPPRPTMRQLLGG